MRIRSFMPFPVLKTERLTLRQAVHSDEREIFALRSDPEVNKHIERTACATISDARNFITQLNKDIHTNDILYWAITYTAENNLLGTICLFNFSDVDGTCEIGFECLPNFHGKGIMKEAMEKVIEYAFYTIQVWKIEAFLNKSNLNSVRLLEKCSFKYSATPDKNNPAFICFYLTNEMDDGSKPLLG